jgi:hypothetical protein
VSVTASTVTVATGSLAYVIVVLFGAVVSSEFVCSLLVDIVEEGERVVSVLGLVVKGGVIVAVGVFLDWNIDVD